MQQESHMHTKSPGKFFNISLISADTVFPVQNEESWLHMKALGAYPGYTTAADQGRGERKEGEQKEREREGGFDLGLQQ